MKVKKIRFEKDYDKFWEEFNISRQNMKKHLKSLPFEGKWEMIQKAREFLDELKKAKEKSQK